MMIVTTVIQRLDLAAANRLVHKAVGTVETLFPIVLVDSVGARECFFLLVPLGLGIFDGELALEARLGVVETQLGLVIEIGEGWWGIEDVGRLGWVAGGASIWIDARHGLGGIWFIRCALAQVSHPRTPECSMIGALILQKCAKIVTYLIEAKMVQVVGILIAIQL